MWRKPGGSSNLDVEGVPFSEGGAGDLMGLDLRFGAGSDSVLLTDPIRKKGKIRS